MATPTRGLIGTGVKGVGALTVVPPAHAIDDILVLIHGNNHETSLLTTAAGFVEAVNSPNGQGTAGATSSSGLAVYWVRATSTAMASPVLGALAAGAGAQIVTIPGCIATGVPINISASDHTSGATTAIDIPGALTTVNECLILAIVVDHLDSGVDKVSPGSFANVDLASVSEWSFFRANGVGNGCGFAYATGDKAGFGAYGTTTATGTQTLHQTRMSLAFMPPATASTPMSVKARNTVVLQQVNRASRW